MSDDRLEKLSRKYAEKSFQADVTTVSMAFGKVLDRLQREKGLTTLRKTEEIDHLERCMLAFAHGQQEVDEEMLKQLFVKVRDLPGLTPELRKCIQEQLGEDAMIGDLMQVEGLKICGAGAVGAQKLHTWLQRMGLGLGPLMEDYIIEFNRRFLGFAHFR